MGVNRAPDAEQGERSAEHIRGLVAYGETGL